MQCSLSGPIATGAILAACLAACGRGQPSAAEAVAQADCAAGGLLDAEIHGAFRASLHWDDSVLDCEGMPRPNGEGARLRFAGPLAEGSGRRQLTIILGLPGLARGETGTELATNVTLIEEDAGRFFNTGDAAGCWTDVVRQEPATGGADSGEAFRIAGSLYCVSPLAELNGSASVTISTFEFSGVLDWREPE